MNDIILFVVILIILKGVDEKPFNRLLCTQQVRKIFIFTLLAAFLAVSRVNGQFINIRRA